jgi:hypothetical protein
MDIDFKLIQNLFFERSGYGSSRKNYYSSIAFHELTSSVISVYNKTHCLHCGNEATPVQKSINNGISSFDRDFVSVGHRCNCEDALKEMARLAAYEITGFKHQKESTSFSDRDDLIKRIIQNRKRITLHELSSSRNGEITDGSCLPSFFSRDNLSIIHDNYYSYTPLHQFGILVKSFAQEIIDFKRDEFQRQIADSEAFINKKTR